MISNHPYSSYITAISATTVVSIPPWIQLHATKIVFSHLSLHYFHFAHMLVVTDIEFLGRRYEIATQVGDGGQ
jgi:hypothetical protein